MKPQVINTWSELVEQAESHEGWAFRGQRHASWDLWSSLSRYLIGYVPDQRHWPEREARAIRIFRRKAHSYMTDPGFLEDDLRCLALMQHHGAPTRLFDFTKSPYVATFFAFERAAEDAALYALNTPLLWGAAPRRRPRLTPDVVNPAIPGRYEKYFLSNRYPLVWIGEPERMDRRLVAQSGTFVIPGLLDRPIDRILAESYSGRGEPLLKKFILKARMRKEAMESLYRMNITYASLFPDLDGLAKASGFELEIIWRGLERPEARRRRPIR
jgi:hypothetical protein